MRFAALLVSFAAWAADPGLEKAFRIARDAVDNGQVPGAVALVAGGGKVLREEAYGLADIERQVPFRKNTLCWLASITKPVTATAVMTLVEAGKLALDDPAEKYLPEFREQKAADGRHYPFTLRHLLTHTAGLTGNPPTRKPSWPIGDALEDYWLAEPLPRIVGSIAASTLRFPPGSKVEYSNSGYFVLGRIVEIVSGRPYAAYVKQKVLDPLGMRETGYRPGAAHPERVAVLYGKRDGKLSTVFRFKPGFQIVNTAPDGGLFSYPGELVKFARLFQQNGGKVLSPRSVEEMLREQAPGRGLGWALEDGVIAHAGSSGTKVWFERNGLIAILFVQYRDRPDTIDALRERFWKAVLESRR